MDLEHELREEQKRAEMCQRLRERSLECERMAAATADPAAQARYKRMAWRYSIQEKALRRKWRRV